jgi:hypothetical protein
MRKPHHPAFAPSATLVPLQATDQRLPDAAPPALQFGGSYPNSAGSSSMLRIGTSSADFRPSHRTIAAALLAVMRSTTPRRSVQSNLRARLLLLNAAATRAMSFTRSPRLIIFSPLVECTPRTSHSKQRTTKQPKSHRLQYSAVPMRYRNTHASLVIAAHDWVLSDKSGEFLSFKNKFGRLRREKTDASRAYFADGKVHRFNDDRSISDLRRNLRTFSSENPWCQQMRAETSGGLVVACLANCRFLSRQRALSAKARLMLAGQVIGVCVMLPSE